MANKIKNIFLTEEDKCYLKKLLAQSTLEIRVYQRAKILLLKSEGMSNEVIADKLDIGIGVVKRCLKKFKDFGIETALHDNQGRGRKQKSQMMISHGLLTKPVKSQKIMAILLNFGILRAFGNLFIP